MQTGGAGAGLAQGNAGASPVMNLNTPPRKVPGMEMAAVGIGLFFLMVVWCMTVTVVVAVVVLPYFWVKYKVLKYPLPEPDEY